MKTAEKDLLQVRAILQKAAKPEVLDEINAWIVALEEGKIAKVSGETVEGVLATVAGLNRPEMRSRLVAAAEGSIEREVYVESVVVPQMLFDMGQVKKVVDPELWPRIEKYYEFVMAEERSNGATGIFPEIDPVGLANDSQAIMEAIPKKRRLLRGRVEGVLASLGYGADPANSFDDDMQALVDGDDSPKPVQPPANDGTGLPDFEDDDELAELV